jgi:hypothetical protein
MPGTWFPVMGMETVALSPYTSKAVLDEVPLTVTVRRP